MRLPLGLVRVVVLAGSRPLGRPVPLAVQRGWLEAQSRLGRPPAGTSVLRAELGGRPAERVSGPDPDRSRAVLLLHGGAFTTCSPRTHRVFAAHLAAVVGAPVWVLDHRRAPEHPHPAAVDDADAALAALESTARTAVVGDSAGGALALLLALLRRAEGRPLPTALGLVSPVADLTLELSRGWTGADPVLRPSWVEDGVRAFVGDGDAAALSPLHADLTGLPPVLVQVSEHERLRPEGELLATRLREADVPSELQLLPGLWHDVHLQADLVPEGAEAVAVLGRWLRAASQAPA
jgi:epsilon-lactone hydrolase